MSARPEIKALLRATTKLEKALRAYQARLEAVFATGAGLRALSDEVDAAWRQLDGVELASEDDEELRAEALDVDGLHPDVDELQTALQQASEDYLRNRLRALQAGIRDLRALLEPV